MRTDKDNDSGAGDDDVDDDASDYDDNDDGSFLQRLERGNND